MNRTRKSITVHFFSINATRSFFEHFRANFRTTKNSLSDTTIFNTRSKKHFIKLFKEIKHDDSRTYSVSVVRERNTWQTKATRDGKITGISLNQGIIGDPYYFLVVPDKNILLGLTSGPSGSLKTVGQTMLEQFNNNRAEKISLDLIPKEKEFATLNDLPEYSSLHFKIDSSSLTDISEDAPQMIKDLSSAPYIEGNMQLVLDLSFDGVNEDKFSKDSIIEIVNFLSDHDGCTVLKVKGRKEDGESIHLDFGNAFLNYKTDIYIRQNFIDEKSATEILNSALDAYNEQPI